MVVIGSALHIRIRISCNCSSSTMTTSYQRVAHVCTPGLFASVKHVTSTPPFLHKPTLGLWYVYGVINHRTCFKPACAIVHDTLHIASTAIFAHLYSVGCLPLFQMSDYHILAHSSHRSGRHEMEGLAYYSAGVTMDSMGQYGKALENYRKFLAVCK